jgi:hypothetical protein
MRVAGRLRQGVPGAQEGHGKNHGAQGHAQAPHHQRGVLPCTHVSTCVNTYQQTMSTCIQGCRSYAHGCGLTTHAKSPAEIQREHAYGRTTVTPPCARSRSCLAARAQLNVEGTRNERHVLESVQHPFIVRLWSAFHDHGRLYLLMDWHNGGQVRAVAHVVHHPFVWSPVSYMLVRLRLCMCYS